ncbi:FMN-binding protein [Acidimangrovimonas sediminis]|uniref:FMN-binding protein n=1 Tax=Acidimangrovimonas sediminis TaxID=2056283 RepID=UPI000C8013FB|nr:FMN-binding protein [Acidimangrovimonas sediminis]
MTNAKDLSPLTSPFVSLLGTVAIGLFVGLGPVPALAATYRDGNYTGGTYSAYYGQVQVRAVVNKGQLVKVDILRYPSDRYTSRRIAERSLPVLEREAIAAQGSHVSFVSGASLTSRAFTESLHSALVQAL